jgi:hypothetical protein
MLECGAVVGDGNEAVMQLKHENRRSKGGGRFMRATPPFPRDSGVLSIN